MQYEYICRYTIEDALRVIRLPDIRAMREVLYPHWGRCYTHWGRSEILLITYVYIRMDIFELRFEIWFEILMMAIFDLRFWSEIMWFELHDSAYRFKDKIPGLDADKHQYISYQADLITVKAHVWLIVFDPDVRKWASYWGVVLHVTCADWTLSGGIWWGLRLGVIWVMVGCVYVDHSETHEPWMVPETASRETWTVNESSMWLMSDVVWV